MNPAPPNAPGQDGDPHAAGLAPLELMGALTIRLIHDLSNQLTILAGNAQVLEMVRHNPERLGKVIERVKTSATAAGELMDRFARFRQQLRLRSAAQPAAAGVRELEALKPPGMDWPVQAGELRGKVDLEPRWFAFTLWQIVLLTRAPAGRLEITEGPFPEDWPAPGHVPTRLKERPALRCELTWSGPGPWLDEREAAKPMNLSLAVAYELIKVADGWPHYQFLPAAGEHRFNVFLPLAG